MKKFKQYIILCTLPTFLGSCGDNAENYIDPILMPYVLDFEEFIGVEIDYDVSIKDLKKDKRNGICRKRPLKKQVIIDADFVNLALQEDQEEQVLWLMPIIYHELGHCSLNLEHNNKILPNGKPVSWMYPKTPMIIDQWTQEEILYYKQEIKETYENVQKR